MITLSEDSFIFIFDISSLEFFLISKTKIKDSENEISPNLYNNKINLSFKQRKKSSSLYKSIKIKRNNLYCGGQNQQISVFSLLDLKNLCKRRQTIHFFSVSGLDSNFGIFFSGSICGITNSRPQLITKENSKGKICLFDPNLAHIRSIICLQKFGKSLSGGRNGKIGWLDYRSQKRYHRVLKSGHNDIIYLTKKIKNENFIVIADHKGIISLWDSFSEISFWKVKTDYMPRALVSPPGNIFYIGFWYLNSINLIEHPEETSWQNLVKNILLENKNKKNESKREIDKNQKKKKEESFFSKIKNFFN